MTYELEGTIKIIGDTATFGTKGFTKRDLIVTTTGERFPQDIKVEFVKEKTEVLDKYQVGQQVRVAFDIRGSEYNGKHYVSLTGWKIDDSAGGSPASSGGGGGGGARQSGGGGGGGGNYGNSAPRAAAKPNFTEDDFNQASKDDEYPF
jgi:hypothetical protein